MTVQPAGVPAITLQFERPQDGPLVDALIDRAFGPGRFTKVSERVREFATFAPELSVCAWSPGPAGVGRLMGCARMWRVRVGGRPAMFLGPFAVEQGERNAGFGARLIARACEAAQGAGDWTVMGSLRCECDEAADAPGRGPASGLGSGACARGSSQLHVRALSGRQREARR